MLTDVDVLLLCALLIFVAARGEALLCVSERIKRLLGLLPILLLSACFIPDEAPRPGPCRDCHRDCGVLRDDCHARCDEKAFCRSEDEQLGAGGADLRSVGLYVAPETLATDAERSAALIEAGSALHPTGRRLFLRCAASFIGRGFEARADGDAAEASRWAERAIAELDRYREPGPELHPYVVAGGAL